MSKFWYCVKHHVVEDADGCPPIDRLGPFATREEAQRALETAKKRNEDWENEDWENDPNWNDEQLED